MGKGAGRGSRPVVFCVYIEVATVYIIRIYICAGKPVLFVFLRSAKKEKKACARALDSYAGYIGCHLCRTTLLLPSQTRAIDLWRLAAKCQCSAK